MNSLEIRPAIEELNSFCNRDLDFGFRRDLRESVPRKEPSFRVGNIPWVFWNQGDPVVGHRGGALTPNRLSR